MINKFYLGIILVLIFGISTVSSFGYNKVGDKVEISTTTYTGNLTNLSQLQDTNITTPTDGYVLTWDSTTGKWTDESASAVGDTNCSADGSCDLITYDSELNYYTDSDIDGSETAFNGWDKDASNDFISILNFTGTLTDTKYCVWDATNGIINCTEEGGSGITWANVMNGTLYLSSNPSGFYNSTDFDISDYFTKTEIIGFSYYNATDFDISDYSTTTQMNTAIENANTSLYDWVVAQDYTAGGIDWSEATNGTLMLQSTWDSNYTTNNALWLADEDSFVGNYSTFLTHLSWADLWSVVYNETEVDNLLSSQDTCSEITGCVENAITDGNTNWDNEYDFITNVTMNKSVSWEDLIGVPTGFSDGVDNVSAGGADWTEITSIPVGFDDDVDNDTTYSDLSEFNNDLNFITNATMNKTVSCSDITGGDDGDFCSDAESSGISWADATNGTLVELSTLLGLSYYNATDFDIADYFTSAEILGFSYYNSTDFSIDDYLTKADWDSNYSTNNDLWLADEDTTYTAGSNMSLDGNEFSVNVAGLKTYFDTIYEAVGSYLSSAVEYLTSGNSYISLNDSSGAVEITFNETKLNATIEELDTDTNLTEDDVESYVFDSDNTANLNMSNYNITLTGYLCLDSDCSSYIYNNGTGVLIQG